MRYGKVIQYFPDKGFGFIRPDTGPDVFFHVTALGACESEPEIPPGQPVKYELKPGTEPKYRRRGRRRNVESEPEEPAVKPQAELVELIDKIPGATLDESPAELNIGHHPRARQKKPTWRS